MNRQKVIEYDIPVDIDGVRFNPGGRRHCRSYGVVVVPQEVEVDVIGQAWAKVQSETRVREEIRQGMKASEAWERFGIL